jgi:hypothetical protein
VALARYCGRCGPSIASTATRAVKDLTITAHGELTVVVQCVLTHHKYGICVSGHCLHNVRIYIYIYIYIYVCVCVCVSVRVRACVRVGGGGGLNLRHGARRYHAGWSC